MKARVPVALVFAGLALACGSAEQRQAILDEQEAERAAREAAPSQDAERLQGLRADLVAIGLALDSPLPEAGEPEAPPLDLLLSLEPQVVFRKGSEKYARSDNANWAEQTHARPLLLAVVQIDELVLPGGVWEGAAFVPGSFEPGRLQGQVTLWDIQAHELLCAAPVQALSSAQVDLGGLIPKDGQSAVLEDFEAQVGAELNGIAESWSPGLKLAI